MRDQNLTKRTAGPTAAGTTYTSALDTRAPDGVGDLAGRAKLFLAVPAIVGLSNTKVQSFTIQDSADNSTFADVAAYTTKSYTGAGSTGAPAADHYFEWRSELKRYIRIKMVLDATPGTITAYNFDFGVQVGSQPGV